MTCKTLGLRMILASIMKWDHDLWILECSARVCRLSDCITGRRLEIGRTVRHRSEHIYPVNQDSDLLSDRYLPL
jgi:hypothetical protein